MPRRPNSRLLLAGVAASLLVSLGPAAAPATSSETSAAARITAAQYESRLLTRINQVRRNHGAVAVRGNRCVDGFAERWAGHLARSGRFYHQDLRPIMRRCHLTRAGEILAKGNITPRRMVRLWMNSSGHRRIMLSRPYRVAGVAARRDGRGNWVGCVVFGRR